MSDKEAAGPAASITAVLDSLIRHMNASRRLYMTLIAAAFIMAPTSLVFITIMLLPGIVSEIGPNYMLDAELDQNSIDFIDDYYVPLDGEVLGTFDGRFVGRMLGNGAVAGGPAAGEEEAAADPAYGGGEPPGGHARGGYYGEFVGRFDGEPAVMSGEFAGEFAGGFDNFYEGVEHLHADHPGDPHFDAFMDVHMDTFGIYDGEFEGTFTGSFYNIRDYDAFAEKIEAMDPADILKGADSLNLEYVPTDSELGSESPLRFMAIDDADTPHSQTDITFIMVAFMAVMLAVSVAVLYVGIREFLFYSRWSPRFARYTRQRKSIDDELGHDGDIP